MGQLTDSDLDTLREAAGVLNGFHGGELSRRVRAVVVERLEGHGESSDS